MGLIASEVVPVPDGEAVVATSAARFDLLDDLGRWNDYDQLRGFLDAATALLYTAAWHAGVSPIQLVREAARTLASDPVIAARPYVRLDDDPDPSTTTNERNPMSPLRKSKSDAQVDPERAALEATFAGRPSVRVDGPAVVETQGWTAERQRQADVEALAEAGEVQLSDDGLSVIAVRVPTSPDRPEYANEHQFAWRDDEWESAAGHRLGGRLARSGRYERAAALGRLGRLAHDEREHLAWLATSPGAWDDVAPGTEALTPAQAALILEAAEGLEQRGRPNPRPGSIASTVDDLEGILERRGAWGA